MAQMWESSNNHSNDMSTITAETMIRHPSLESDSLMDRTVYHSPSPEGTSSSDKLDKMDTSETSVSSGSPLVDACSNLLSEQELDANIKESERKYHSITEAKELAKSLKAVAIANHNGVTELGHVPTDNSFHDDADLPANYLTETVDFPDSPHQLKLMQRSANGLQSASDDATQDADESSWMDQQEDDVFRNVLSPESEEAILKKDCDQTDVSFKPSCVPTSTPNVTDISDELKFRYKTLSLTTERSTENSHNLYSCQTLVDKISNCYSSNLRVKDLDLMCENFKSQLSMEEVNHILENRQLFSTYLDEYVFEALEILTTDSPMPNTNSTTKKTKVKVDYELLDDSIVNHFENELQMEAVFERTPSIRIGRSLIRKRKETPNVKVEDKILEKQKSEPDDDESNLVNTARKTVISVPPALLHISEFDDSMASSNTELNSSQSSVKAEDMIENDDLVHSDILTFHKPQKEWEISQINYLPDDLNQSSPERPSSLNTSGKKKRKIKVHPDILNASEENDDKSLSSLSNRSDGDILSPSLDDIVTPDDIATPDVLDDSIISPAESIPEVSAAEERDEERRWRTCVVSGVQQKIDMKVIEPYKKVLSHGGYYGPKRSAIIVFCACYLPDHGRKDYDYVMDHLFLYVLTTLDQLVAEDYMLIYLHGALDRNNIPTFGWLKRCYTLIDRRLRKNLKGLYLVHPTFWLKTIVLMTKPFVSSKFSRKLQFVSSLQELYELLPVDQMAIPDKVKQADFTMMIKTKKKHTKTDSQRHNSTDLKKEIEDEIRTDCSNKVDVDAPYRLTHSESKEFTGGWL